MTLTDVDCFFGDKRFGACLMIRDDASARQPRLLAQPQRRLRCRKRERRWRLARHWHSMEAQFADRLVTSQRANDDESCDCVMIDAE